jgi:hypothetical protein
MSDDMCSPARDHNRLRLRRWLLVCIGVCPGLATAEPPEKQLLGEASAALQRKQPLLAATLLQGVWEMTQDADVLRRLAKAQGEAGLPADAVESYQRLLQSKPSAEVARDAQAAIARLRLVSPPDQLPQRLLLTKEATLTFARGMALKRQKQEKQAVRYLRASLVLDPTLPGAHRVLGMIYGQAGDPVKERSYLLEYLRLRPDGRIADIVRRRLQPSGILGSVDIAASYTCDVWVNGRALGKRTPLKGLLLPPGKHTFSLVNGTYHIVRNRHVIVRSGTKETVDVPFGLLTIKLSPWARVTADGRDLGLWETIGLPVGEHRLKLVAHDGSRHKQVSVTIKAASTVSITSW